MVIHLPEKKHYKAHLIVQNTLKRNFLSLPEIPKNHRIPKLHLHCKLTRKNVS